MSLSVELPQPLQVKLDSWEIPEEVRLEVVKVIAKLLEGFPETHGVTHCRPFETYIKGFDFWGRVSAKSVDGKLVMIDCDVDWVTNC